MKKLFIENSGVEVPVAGLELISGKQQVVIGNLERDLVLCTVGNIKIQVGNKFYDLPINTDESSSTYNINNGAVKIYNSMLEVLNDTLKDGDLLYTRDENTLYLYINSTYLPLIGQGTGDVTTIPTPTPQGLLLSYGEVQALVGEQKRQVILNTGYVVNNFLELADLAEVDFYPNQVIYNIGANQHYKLIDVTKPYIESSWRALYVSSYNGGVVNNSVKITVSGNSERKALLHIEDPYDALTLSGDPLSSVFLHGSSSLNKGYAQWYNSSGEVFFKTLQDFAPLNIVGSNNGTIMRLNSNSISMLGGPRYGYRTTINSNLYVSEDVTAYGIKSVDFNPGFTGYSLRNTINGSLLEVDNLIVRNTEPEKVSSKSLNGSLWSTKEITFPNVQQVVNTNVFVRKENLGNYKFTGTYIEVPLGEKPTYATVITIDEFGVGTPALQQLEFGVGDKTSGGADSIITTFTKDETGAYITPIGTHSLVGGEYVDTEDGTHILAYSINEYEVSCENVLDVGDLLMSIEWTGDVCTELVLAEVLSTTTIEDLPAYRIKTHYGYFDGDSNTKFVIIGNKTIPKSITHQLSDFLNGSYLINRNDVNEFLDLIENRHYYLDTLRLKNTGRIILGNLLGISDSELGLAGVTASGLYGASDVFLRGNFVANKFVMPKNGDGKARIEFPYEGSGNDPAYIEHEEYGVDTSRMKFSGSDNSDAIDYFTFGAEPAGVWTDGLKFFTNGTIVLGTWNATPITDTYISSSATWNEAYSWGDHSLVGYLTAESDTLQTVLQRGSVAENYSIGLINGDIFIIGTTIDEPTQSARVQLTNGVETGPNYFSSLGIAMQLGAGGDLLLQTYSDPTGSFGATAGTWYSGIRIKNTTGEVTCSSDIESIGTGKGLILKDTVTGTRHRITLANGVLTVSTAL